MKVKYSLRVFFLHVVENSFQVEVVCHIHVRLTKGRIYLGRVEKIELLPLVIYSCLKVEESSIDFISIIVNRFDEGLNFCVFLIDLSLHWIKI